jgi:Fur family transcriptional regulator, ferric uptake regulator
VTTVRHTHADHLVAPDEIVAHLREAGHSVGRTRTAVVDAVRARPAAFTADELAAAVPAVHVSTVYRTLGLLEEIGAVRHVHLSHGPALYEHAGSAEVRHLVCEVCDRHVAVPADIFESVRERLARDFDFVLAGSHFAIVGRCRDHADP